VLDRVEKMGDLFAPLGTLKQKLPKLAGIESAQAEAMRAGLEIAASAEKPAASVAKKAKVVSRRVPAKAARPASKKKARKV
jgi:hypothetical protein